MLRLHEVRLRLASFDLELDLELPCMVTAVTGASGSGKTSLLDLIAGLRKPVSARIQAGDRWLVDMAKGINLPAEQRGIGYVPQDLALFPHLSAGGNIRYGARRLAEGRAAEMEHVLRVLEIEALLERRISELSGGEQQRVALARALVSGPRLLLLDEPLESLDSALRTRVLPFLQRVRDEFKIPMLYVTHDEAEAAAMAEEIIVMERGRVAARRSCSKPGR